MPELEAEELLSILDCLEASPKPPDEELEGALLLFAGGTCCLLGFLASADMLLLCDLRSVF